MCSLLWMNTNQNRKQKDYNEGPWQVACLRIMSYFSKLVICIPTILLPLAFELFSKLFWEGMGYSGWKFCMNVWRRGVESFFFVLRNGLLWGLEVFRGGCVWVSVENEGVLYWFVAYFTHSASGLYFILIPCSS